MNAADEPLDSAAVDNATTQLRHARLPNAEMRGDDMLALRAAEGSGDFRGQLLPDDVDRIVGGDSHAVVCRRAAMFIGAICRMGALFSAGGMARPTCRRPHSKVGIIPIRGSGHSKIGSIRDSRERCDPMARVNGVITDARGQWRTYTECSRRVRDHAVGGSEGPAIADPEIPVRTQDWNEVGPAFPSYSKVGMRSLWKNDGLGPALCVFNERRPPRRRRRFRGGRTRGSPSRARMSRSCWPRGSAETSGASRRR